MINDTVPREPTGQIINKMKLTHAVCVEVASFGSYESIRRDVSYNSPLILTFDFLMAAIVYYLMPLRLKRFFGDTAGILTRKPIA
jgi:hypothetical protein